MDYALTLDQTLRFGFNMFRTTNGNLGIGAFDEEERAFSTGEQTHTIRVQHMGPLGRRAFTRTRVQMTWSDSESRSAVEAPTIRVNDAFTSGGAQVAGGQHSRTVDVGVGSRLRARQSTGPHRHSDRRRAVALGRRVELPGHVHVRKPRGVPRRPSAKLHAPHRRSEHPLSQLQGGLYVQDDIRVRRNLTLSAGVRYEAQTHVDDFDNLAPRFGVTWAPFASGRTTLRSSWGIFYDWLPNEHLRADAPRRRLPSAGTEHRQSVVSRLAGVGALPPINRYLLGDGLRLPRRRA